MDLNHIRYGTGKPILLIHGIGGTWRSWAPIIPELSKHRQIIAIDLPGSGKTPPLKGENSVVTLTDAVVNFLDENRLTGIDVVGSSMGGRLVLEIVKIGGVVGSAVALDPGGFWQGIQTHILYSSLALSIRIVRLLKRVGWLPAVTKNVISRSVLFAQLSAQPGKINYEFALNELNGYAAAATFDELLYDLVYGQKISGLPAGSLKHPLVIGWGKKDWVCFPGQAKKAMELFPDASLHWFDNCGHFPHWDQPKKTIDLILNSTAQGNIKKQSGTYQSG